jgi:hypothetical protein
MASPCGANKAAINAVQADSDHAAALLPLGDKRITLSQALAVKR